MIKAYFDELEKTLGNFPVIRTSALTKKSYNIYQGYIAGKIGFDNGFWLYFTEVVDVEIGHKLKYRYQVMDENLNLVFRYDNAPHYPNLSTFPHHKHEADRVEASPEPSLQSVLLEISKIIKEGG